MLTEKSNEKIQERAEQAAFSVRHVIATESVRWHNEQGGVT